MGNFARMFVVKTSADRAANVREVISQAGAKLEVLLEGKNLFPVFWCLPFEDGDAVRVRPGRAVLDAIGGPDRERWMLASPTHAAVARARARAKRLRKLCVAELKAPLDAFVQLLDETDGVLVADLAELYPVEPGDEADLRSELVAPIAALAKVTLEAIEHANEEGQLGDFLTIDDELIGFDDEPEQLLGIPVEAGGWSEGEERDTDDDDDEEDSDEEDDEEEDDEEED